MTDIIAKVEGKKGYNNYKDRITAFYDKNKLNKTHSVSFFEQPEKLVIHCSVPNLRLSKRINRIIKLIAHYKHHKWEIFSVNEGKSLKEMLELMKEC